MNDSNKTALMFARYIFIVLIGLGDLYLFYKILTPLTVFVVANITSLFMEIYVVGNIIVTNDYIIRLIPACVAGSAFFLLTLLVFSTAEIKPIKRLLVLISAFVILFILNVARILFLIAIAGKEYFDIVHWTLWNLISIFFVVAVWFFVAWAYKIKTVPVYSDIVFLKSLTKKKIVKKRKKHK